MKHNPSPEGSGNSWNSEDLVFDRMTCSQLAKICTSFVGILRLARYERETQGVLGILKVIRTICDHQIALSESKELSEEEKKALGNSAQTALIATSMAAACVADSIDPRHLSQLSISVIDSLHALANQVGPIGDDDVVVVDVRKGDVVDVNDAENLQMSLRLEPISILQDVIKNTDFGKKIEKIVRGSEDIQKMDGNN